MSQPAFVEPRESAISEPHIIAAFSLQGRSLPADHGYLVYSAISRAFPTLHGIDWLGIELISGFPSGRGLINLPERDATLRLRIPAAHYRDVLLLAGKRLDIGGHQIRLGLPVARPIELAPSLYARVVTVKKFTEAEPFLEAVKRKLDSFGVKGRVELPRAEVRAGAEGEQGRYRRRIVTIHGKSNVGFSVAVHDLNDQSWGRSETLFTTIIVIILSREKWNRLSASVNIYQVRTVSDHPAPLCSTPLGFSRLLGLLLPSIKRQVRRRRADFEFGPRGPCLSIKAPPQAEAQGKGRLWVRYLIEERGDKSSDERCWMVSH